MIPDPFGAHIQPGDHFPNHQTDIFPQTTPKKCQKCAEILVLYRKIHSLQPFNHLSHYLTQTSFQTICQKCELPKCTLHTYLFVLCMRKLSSDIARCIPWTASCRRIQSWSIWCKLTPPRGGDGAPRGPEPSFFLIIYNSRLAARPPNEASDKNGGGFGRRHSVTVF